MLLNSWENYDPSWLIEASESLNNEYPWLTNALRNCTRAKKESEFYIYFVNPKKSNKLKSDWQFVQSITLEDTIYGDIVIDILKDHRIGGVEFLSKLIDSRK